MPFAMPALPALIFLPNNVPTHADMANTPRPLGKECAHMPLALPDLLIPTRAHFNTELLLILWINTQP